MAEPAVSILMIGLTGAQRARLEQAASGAALVALESLDAALQRPEATGPETVVLADEREQERALAAVTRDGLPRWAVVVFPAQELGARLADAAALHAARRDAARARGDLLTIARRISHEMRSPLGCILTSADVMQEELAASSELPPALLAPIVESANDVLALIDRVSLVARASVTRPAPVDVEMGMTVWAAREYLAAKIAAAGAEVTEPPDWPVVRGVREWLERIWFNLLANAVQHGGPRPRIELGWTRVDGGTRFFVRDHGPGVPREFRDTVFRPFHRLHEKDSGRGLGLAIVQRLVELQGGTSGHEAVDSGGSCFYFALPDSVPR